jgi:DNA-binding transcriptional LysR family regulator
MELFQLQSFLRVAARGSITRAAETLCLTQPAVTQHVRALERELGTALFERTGRGVRLTPAGHALRDYARRSVGLLDECRQAISDLGAGTAGRLILGAGVTTSIFHLPVWLRAFQGTHPGIDVVVRTGRSREVAAMALEREIDVGLVTSPVQHPDLCVSDLFDEEIILVTPPGHPLSGPVVPGETMADAPLILYPHGTGFRDFLDRALTDAGIAAHVKMETDSVEAIKSFVAVGLGVSFLPAAAVEAEIASGTLARARIAGLPPLRRKTAVLYRADRYLSAGAQGFLDILGAVSAGGLQPT